jgi:1-acyl-sn-glycerol-3-phosphate acyltransferase
MNSKTSVNSRFSPWVTAIVYPIGRYLVLPKYFKEIKVNNIENVPTSGPVILAPTHRSRWDSLLLIYAIGPYVTGRNLRYMVSMNEMTGFQGWILRRLGCFPVDTNQPSIGSFRHGVELLNQGEMLVIFPEGNIFRDRQIAPLKKGLARIALQAMITNPHLDIKIIPISIKYDSPIPKWGGNVTIDIGEPLIPQECNYDRIKESTKDLTAKLTRSLELLTPLS